MNSLYLCQTWTAVTLRSPICIGVTSSVFFSILWDANISYFLQHMKPISLFRRIIILCPGLPYSSLWRDMLLSSPGFWNQSGTHPMHSLSLLGVSLVRNFFSVNSKTTHLILADLVIRASSGGTFSRKNWQKYKGSLPSFLLNIKGTRKAGGSFELHLPTCVVHPPLFWLG